VAVYRHLFFLDELGQIAKPDALVEPEPKFAVR
jgi:hypothetical protein